MMNSKVIKDLTQEPEEKAFTYLKKVCGFSQEDNRVYLRFADRTIMLEVISANIIRVLMSQEKCLDLSTSPAVVKKRDNFQDYELSDLGNYLEIKTDNLRLSINLQEYQLKFFDKRGHLINSDQVGKALGYWKDEIIARKVLQSGERFYGLGEKTGFLDKRGRKYTMWNTDVFEPHVESTDPLYVSVPFLLSLNAGRSYGIFFDNTYKTHFDLGFRNQQEYSFWAEGGKMDYYFIMGPEIKEVLFHYTELTGRIPLPPKWALGHHQSRYSYYPQEKVLDLADEFRKRDIPCDAIHLDIHYLNGYRVFTWDESRFPQPEEMLRILNKRGFKVVTIINPGVKKDPEYNIYIQGIKNHYFCKYLDGQVYVGEVWPGDCVFPDFTRKEVRVWWGDLHKQLLDLGVKGIWNDMNEPAVFNENSTMDLAVIHENDGDWGTHRRYHNIYALLECQASYEGMRRHGEERPFILSRAGFAGIQRYAALWTGDNRSFWEHLKLTIPMLLNMGLSGLPFVGSDIGGFTGDSNGQLLTRWYQMAVFMPFFRNHCSIDGVSQEPWAFGKEYEDIIRNYIKLRYRLIEYIYNLFYQSSRNGLPVIRPLFLEYPDDEKTYNISDQFLLGSDMMIAPICQPDQNKRMVYLPAGNWINFWDNEQIRGNSYIIADAPLGSIPVYIRSGSIIPLVMPDKYIRNENGYVLILNIYLDQDIEQGDYSYYLDDGLSFKYEKGEYNLIDFSYHWLGENIEFIIDYKKTGYHLRPDYFQLRFINLNRKVRAVEIDGNQIEEVNGVLKDDLLLKCTYGTKKVGIYLERGGV